MSIGIDFGIGIDENSWYRPGIVSKPKKLVSPIPSLYRVIQTRFFRGFHQSAPIFLKGYFVNTTNL